MNRRQTGMGEGVKVWVKENKRRVSFVSLFPSYTGSKVLTGHSCTHLGSWRILLQLPQFPRHISPSHGCRTSTPHFGPSLRESVTGLDISHLIKKERKAVNMDSGRFKNRFCGFIEQWSASNCSWPTRYKDRRETSIASIRVLQTSRNWSNKFILHKCHKQKLVKYFH